MWFFININVFAFLIKYYIFDSYSNSFAAFDSVVYCYFRIPKSFKRPDVM